jgi:hypothetical protein
MAPFFVELSKIVYYPNESPPYPEMTILKLNYALTPVHTYGQRIVNI